MKKVIYSFVLVFMLVLLGLNNVKAEENNVEITSIEIQEKSENTISNIEEDNELNYNMNLELYDIDDYITYKIIVKNNSNKDYEIDTITDNLESDYIESSYTTNKKELKKGEEVELYLTLKYKESITTKKETFNHNLVITLKYTNGESSTISDIELDDNIVQIGSTGMNANTIIKIVCYIIIVVSIILLIVLAILRKKKLKSIGLLLLLFIIPSVLAEDNEGKCSLNISITLHSTKTSTFKTGREVNLTMHKLAGAPDDIEWIYNEEYDEYYLYSESMDWYSYSGNGNIISIGKPTEEQYNNIKEHLTIDNIVSTVDSKYPIYMWYEVTGEYWEYWIDEYNYVVVEKGKYDDNGNHEYFEGGIIRWYSDADVVFMNKDSSEMFLWISTLKNIDVNHFDTSNVTDMSYMFRDAGRNSSKFEIDLSSWDVSKVTNMNHMFDEAGEYAMEWNIGDISAWDVSKVTDMSEMFDLAGYNATTFDIGTLSSWDTSNVTDMSKMFCFAGYNATNWNIGDLSSWNVSKVTNMHAMFVNAGVTVTEWNIGDLSAWDTSKVTNMFEMFYGAGWNATKWYIGSLNIYTADISHMFANCPNINVILNIHNVPESYSGMFLSSAINPNSEIVVNYAPEVSDVIDNIIATKSSNSNVVKGSLIQ